MFTEKLAEKIGELSRARNILACQYLDLKWELVKFFIDEAPPAINEFTKTVNSFL